MLPEDDTTHMLKAYWPDAQPPAGIAARVIAHARSMPQHQPFALRLAIAMQHAFSEWNYALAYKGAALAAVAALGVFTSQNIAVADDGRDMLHIATTSWTEEL
jgi:hypothetical protein